MHRTEGAISSAHSTSQPGYAEEVLADDNAELVEFQTPTAPLTASAGDFMKALLVLGWYAAVSAAVASLPDDETGTLAKVLWARATIIERLNPLLIQIATAIGKTSADIDALFILANSYD